MPTINQLVRKGRKTSMTKSTAPALQHGYNSKNIEQLTIEHHKKRSLYSCKNCNTKET